MSTELHNMDDKSQLGSHKILSHTPKFVHSGNSLDNGSSQASSFQTNGKTIQPLPLVDSRGDFLEEIGDLDEDEDLLDVEPITMTVGRTFDSTDGEEDLLEVDERMHNHSLTELNGVNGSMEHAPSVLHSILEERHEDTTPEQPEALPIIHGKVHPRLSVSEDGYIQMGHYKISFDVIGAGRYSEVRIAFDTRDDQQYAIKIFSRTKLQKFGMLLKTSRNPVEEAYREATILRRLSHPNIIKLIEVIDEADDENMYLVLELLERVLIEIPTDTPCSEVVARRFFRDIVDGVAHLHSCGIVHRDLKPENLLVSQGGVVKIADFNICVQLEHDPDDPTLELPVECWQCTPAFCPPECLTPDEKSAAGRPLDMWSLGVTLYTMVVGDLPFKGDLFPDLFKSITSDVPQFPPSRAISDDLRDLVKGLLAKDPRDRLTMQQVQEHPWLRDCPPTREKDDSKRSKKDYSKRCAWTDPPEGVEGGEGGEGVEAGEGERCGGDGVGVVRRGGVLRRRGSAMVLDEEVEKLLMHGYTYL